MSQLSRFVILIAALLTTGLVAACTTYGASPEDQRALDTDSVQALTALSAENPAADALSKTARAVLVFPKVVKAGLGFGGAYGEGELRRNGVVVGRYRSTTASWGLQAGAQSYGYVVYLMTSDAVDYLEDSNGWEIGVGPTVVVVNEGMAANLSTTTFSEDAYAFIFDQQGLMVGISLEGTKISKMK